MNRKRDTSLYNGQDCVLMTSAYWLYIIFIDSGGSYNKLLLIYSSYNIIDGPGGEYRAEIKPRNLESTCTCTQ